MNTPHYIRQAQYKKGFIAPLLLALIALILIGGGAYVYEQSRQTSQSAVVTPITQATSTTSGVVYRNTEYGFQVALPESWEGFTLVNSTWIGYEPEGCEGGNCSVTNGPETYIRHPLWPQTSFREGIPIDVFTIQQWNDLQTVKFVVGAAPMKPSELARNAKYVFALPARYNYDYATGWEEVDRLIKGGAVTAF